MMATERIIASIEVQLVTVFGRRLLVAVRESKVITVVSREEVRRVRVSIIHIIFTTSCS